MNTLRQRSVHRSQLDAYIGQYERDLAQIPGHSDTLLWLIARYSRGDAVADLAAAFPSVIDKVLESDALNRTNNHATTPYFTHEREYAGVFRDALVLLSLSLCLRMPAHETRRLLNCCERGDPLIEALARAATGEAQPVTSPAFPQFFAELYEMISAPGAARASLVTRYLADWPGRLHGFGFLISESDLGFWCFEAAGIVAALSVDDATFGQRTNYPADLGSFARQRRDRKP